MLLFTMDSSFRWNDENRFVQNIPKDRYSPHGGPHRAEMGVLLVRVMDAGSIAHLGTEPTLESRRG